MLPRGLRKCCDWSRFRCSALPFRASRPQLKDDKEEEETKRSKRRKEMEVKEREIKAETEKKDVATVMINGQRENDTEGG